MTKNRVTEHPSPIKTEQSTFLNFVYPQCGSILIFTHWNEVLNHFRNGLVTYLRFRVLNAAGISSYATTLRRAKVSKDDIGEMLGHSNSVVTEHYLASLDIEKTQEINQHIL